MGLIWFDNYTVMRSLQLFLHRSFEFFSKDFKALIDAVLSQDYFIYDDIGWSSDGINGIYVGHGNITDGTGTKNQVSTSHGASIGSFIIVVDVVRTP